jgi:hypothetical protein
MSRVSGHMLVVVEESSKRVDGEAKRRVGLQQVKTADEVEAEKDEGSDEEVSTHKPHFGRDS